MTAAPAPEGVLDDDALRRWPLPAPDPEGDKEHRGRVLVIGGCAEMPGAAVLTATAALRAGAGKLVIATPERAAPWVAFAMPEARVIALPEGDEGAPSTAGIERVASVAAQSQAVVVGPGMQNERATVDFVRALLPSLVGVPLLLDACAMGLVTGSAETHRDPSTPIVLTPHLGEMAHLCGHRDKEAVQADAATQARDAAHAWQATVALKGATTWLADPQGALLRHDRGTVGLGTSGSGDVLAGLIGGLLARGAPPLQAAAWGVALHARAGERLGQRHGLVGYLAREIAAEVPALMQELASPP